MPKSAALEASFLNLLLNGVGISGIADNTVTAPLTSVYVRLHTASPGSTGNQATNEVSYTGYAAQPVARTPGAPAWTITGNTPAQASPNANILFPTSLGGVGGVATYWSVGAAATGASEIFYYGTLTPNVTIVAGVQPVLTTASAITEQ